MENVFFNLISSIKINGRFPSIFSRYVCSVMSDLITLLIRVLLNLMTSIAMKLISMLNTVFYFIAKYILLIVDIIFSYINRLCGLNMDFSSLSTIVSKDSDVVFNLLITARDTITPIIRNLIGLAIFMIIIFTIIALIKSQFEALNGKKPNYIMDVLKKTIKAFVLLLLTPMFVILGIVGSDLLLQSLYRATNANGGTSIGTQIFSASAANANNFRIYADTNQRIPIKFDFTKDNEIEQYYSGKPVTSEYMKYLSNNSTKHATYLMFSSKEYPSYTDAESATYYLIYDKNVDAKGRYADYQKIESNAEQYQVMADVVDYCVNDGVKVYIRTIEQVLDSIKSCENLTQAEKENLLYEYFKKYNIMLLGDSPGEIMASYGSTSKSDLYTKYNAKTWGGISFICNYKSESGKVTQKSEVHVKGKKDELYGAKFVVAGDRGGYYEPLSIGYKKNNKATDVSFYSDYILEGTIVIAKGFMYNDAYPTAIKIKDDNSITCYRENFNISLAGSFSDSVIGSWGTSKKKGILGFLSMFLHPEVSMDLEVNSEDAAISEKTSMKDTLTLSNGELQVGYFQNYSGAFQSDTKITLNTLYNSTKFNFFLMLAASVILFKVAFLAFLGLIQRSYELFLIIIFYPVSVVTIPVEDTGYSSWMTAFVNRLFATYGFILGINFVLMLFPIITKMTFFTQEDIANSKIAFKLCAAFFGGTMRNMATTLNTLVTILFELVAFTLLDAQSEGGITKLINEIMKSEGDLSSDAAENFVKILKSVGKALRIAGKAVVLVLKAIPQSSSVTSAADGVTKTEEAARNAQKFKKFLSNLMPGGKLRQSIAEKKAIKNKKENMEKAKKKAKEKMKTKENFEDNHAKPTLKEGATEEEKKQYQDQLKQWEDQKKQYDQEAAKAAEAQLKSYLDSEKEYTKSLQDPEMAAEEQQAEQRDNQAFGLEQSDFENEEDGGEVNKRDGEGEEGEEGETDESYMSDRDLNKRRKDLKEKLGNIDKVEDGIDDPKKREAFRRAKERQEKELARIEAELEKRKNLGVKDGNIFTRRKRDEEMRARLTELENKSFENNGAGLTPEEKKEYDALQQYVNRHSKKARQEYEHKKELKEQEAAKQKEIEEKAASDDAMFKTKATTEAEIQKRIDEASSRNKNANKDYTALVNKHPELANFQDELKKTTDIDKFLEQKGIKLNAKEIASLKEFNESNAEMERLSGLLDQRAQLQEKWAKNDTDKKIEERKKYAGLGSDTDKDHKKSKKKYESINDEMKALKEELADTREADKLDKDIADLEAKVKADPTNLAQKQKLNELRAKRNVIAEKQRQVDEWEKQNKDTELCANNRLNASEVQNDEKLRKQALKILKDSQKEFSEDDVLKMMDYLRNKKQYDQNARDQKRFEKLGGKSMDDGRRIFNIIPIPVLGRLNRKRAGNKVDNMLEKTKNEINAEKDSKLYKLFKETGVNDISQHSDQQIRDYINNNYTNTGSLSAQDSSNMLLLQKYLDLRDLSSRVSGPNSRYSQVQAERKNKKK